MPTSTFKGLTRRLIWSTSASITLLFLFSTSSQPSVPVTPSGFSLDLDRVFLRQADLRLATRANGRSLAASSEQFRLMQEGDRRRSATNRYLDTLPFAREIRVAAERYEVDSLLLASVIEAESGFHADAVSSKGALGLMQLMPVHFVPTDQPLDPAVNLNLGARYLRDLRNRYGGDLTLALAAYHAGPGTIDRFGGLPPYRETQLYVGRVLRLYSEHQRDAGATPSREIRRAGELPLRLAASGLGS